MTQSSSTMKYIIQVIIKISPLPTTSPPCQRQHVLKRWSGWSLVLVLLAGVLISELTVAYAAGGDLDPTFDTDGVVITAIGSRSDSGTAVAVQGDGKIVVAGSSDRIEGIIGQDYDFAVARYNNDGSLDTTFDTDGIVTTPIGRSSDLGNAVAVQSDGKVVVAGYTGSFDNEFAVARYNNDGSLDTTFDTDGIVTTLIGSYAGEANAVAIQSDGKVVVAGFAWNRGNNLDFGLVRYNDDGSLDTSFGAGGFVLTPIGSTQDYARAMAVQSDGKIVVAGFTNTGGFDDAFHDFAVVRYNSDGSLDTTFDTDGIVTTPIGSGIDNGWAVALQSDGKIVVAGETMNTEKPYASFAVVRYNSDGSLDAGFGVGGIVITSIGGLQDQGYAMAVQSDGKVVVAGDSFNIDGQGNASSNIAIVCYNSDGSLDTGFGTGGKVATSIENITALIRAVAVQTDGKIVVAGESSNNVVAGNSSNTVVGSDPDFTVIRYLPSTSGSGGGGNIYLPLITKNLVTVPDLVIDDVTATRSGAVVTIRNAGTAVTPDAFWVDVYFDPNPAPPGLNQQWEAIAQAGAHWGVTGSLAPGETLTLTIGGSYYVNGSSSFPANAKVYAYVDSINYATTYGNVMESNEANNVFGPVVSAAGAGVVTPQVKPASLEGLPER